MQAQLKEGLVAYYPFNGHAKDERGNGNDGKVNGATLSSDRHGKDNSAYSFDGVDDYISVPGHNDLDLGTGAGKEMTISVWAKDNGNEGAIIGKFSGAGSSNHDYIIYISHEFGGLTWGTGSSESQGGDNVNTWMTTDTIPPADVWHHVLVTYQNSGDGFKRVYLNGQLIKQASIGSKNAANNSPLRIGSEFDRKYWNGKLDDVRIYNRALSEEEITALYDLEKPEAKPGTSIWEFETGRAVTSSPAIGANGTVYVGGEDNKLYALNPKSGVKLWEFKTGGPVISSPAIGSDGTVYIGSADDKLYALSGKTGVKLWEFATGRNVNSSPAIGSGGTVYIGSADNKLYALSGKTGVKLWEFETGDSVNSCPAIGSDGTVYVGSVDNMLYAVNGKSGEKKWEFKTEERVRSSPAIGPDGTVYVGSYDNKLYALNPKSGGKLWEFKTGDAVNTYAAIGPDGTVYVGSYDNKLYAINPKSGAKLWEFKTGAKVSSSPVIGPDGILYIGSGDGKVYAIATSSKSLAKSPWPMFGGNAQHTGRAK